MQKKRGCFKTDNKEPTYVFRGGEDVASLEDKRTLRHLLLNGHTGLVCEVEALGEVEVQLQGSELMLSCW